MQRKTLIHSFIRSFIQSFFHSSTPGIPSSPAAGGGGCAAGGSPLPAATRARSRARPSGALTRLPKSNERPNCPNNHKRMFFPTGDQPLNDFVQREAGSNGDSNFHKFFMPRMVYGREAGDAAWGEDVLTFLL